MLRSSLVNRFHCRPQPSQTRRRPLALEPLEERTLLSTILWTNRGGPVAQGGSGSDSDNFQAIYGASASAARAVVDQAINYWENVIVDFGNITTINGPVHLDAFLLDISATDLGDNLRGETSVSG